MCEKVNPPLVRRRLEYGAVPLQPWSAPHPDMRGENYYQASLRHITERLDTNIHIPIENDTIKSEATLKTIYDFCELSLTDAHTRRIMHHHENGVDKMLTGPSSVIEAAQQGTATPAEMLSVLFDNPQLGAIEIAKLTHPFDTVGDEAMMDDVLTTLSSQEAMFSDDSPSRYKTKRVDASIPAMVVLEKRNLAVLDAPAGVIDVIIRKSFIVRADPDVLDTEARPRIDRLVKQIAGSRTSRAEPTDEQKQAETTLFSLIRGAHQIPFDRTPWLDVLTTSVYAVYR